MDSYPQQAERPMQEEPTERTNLVKEFGWATADLEKTVAELIQRLDPLLRPDYEADKITMLSEPHPPVSAARAELHNLHDQTGRIRWILDRLEV